MDVVQMIKLRIFDEAQSTRTLWGVPIKYYPCHGLDESYFPRFPGSVLRQITDTGLRNSCPYVIH
jgi:hypothetical protein